MESEEPKGHIVGGVVDIFCFPKYRRSLNSNLIEGFVPYQGTVHPTYGMDLDPKGVLSLGHPDVVPILLSFILGFLCLIPGFLN